MADPYERGRPDPLPRNPWDPEVRALDPRERVPIPRPDPRPDYGPPGPEWDWGEHHWGNALDPFVFHGHRDAEALFPTLSVPEHPYGLPMPEPVSPLEERWGEFRAPAPSPWRPKPPEPPPPEPKLDDSPGNYQPLEQPRPLYDPGRPMIPPQVLMDLLGLGPMLPADPDIEEVHPKEMMRRRDWPGREEEV